MALLNQVHLLSSSSSSLPILYFNLSSSPKFFKIPKSPHPKRLIKLSTSSSHTNSPIFLPFLQENTNPPTQDPQIQEEELEKENLELIIKDPIVRFFKSQIEDPLADPSQEGKLTLQQNRKTSWHLAFDNNKDTPLEKNVTLSKTLEKPQLDDTGSVKIGGVIDEILENARSLPQNVTLGEVLEGYKGEEIGEKECVKVLEKMGEEGLIRSCLHFWEWMRLNEPCLVSPRGCSVLFPILGKTNMGEDLMILFKNLPNDLRFKDVHVYNSAISGLLNCGRYDDAWEVYTIMETNNIQPDHVTCSIMITIMRKKGDSAKDSWEFFEKMNKKGVKWSLEVMGALIKSFCDEGLKKEALLIQLEMEKRGISSNAVVYNTIMDSYVKSNHIEEAEGLFNEMKRKGISPTSSTYNVLMVAYSKMMEPEIVEKLLLEMEESGLKPNVKSYTCLISAYGKKRQMSDKAADAFLRMKRVGIKPTSHSYTALIHAYSISGWHEKAYMAYEDMLREGVNPSIETYTALLDAFRRSGDTDNLMKIWKTMMRARIVPTRVTFNVLLDGFAKQGCYVEARDVVCEFGKIGLQPDVMTYNMLINAYVRGGVESKIPQLLKEMGTLGLKPDSVTYSTMIYAYVRVRDFKRAFYFHKEMVKKRQVPDFKSYEKLRSILDVKAKVKNRKDKSALMGIINSSAGLLKEKKKGKKDEFWKNRKPRIIRTYGES